MNSETSWSVQIVGNKFGNLWSFLSALSAARFKITLINASPVVRFTLVFCWYPCLYTYSCVYSEHELATARLIYKQKTDDSAIGSRPPCGRLRHKSRLSNPGNTVFFLNYLYDKNTVNRKLFYYSNIKSFIYKTATCFDPIGSSPGTKLLKIRLVLYHCIK